MSKLTIMITTISTKMTNHYDYAQAHENNHFDDHENDEFIHSQQDCPLAYQ